jgi:hypothetical protein
MTRTNHPLEKVWSDLVMYTKSLHWKLEVSDLCWLPSQPAGICNTSSKTIVICESLSLEQRVKALVHELGHIINFADEALATQTARELAGSLNILVSGDFDKI